MYRITQKRKIFYALSAFLITLGIAFWAIFGLRLGIDFTGGTLIEITNPGNLPISEINNHFASLNFETASIQQVGESNVQIKLKPLTQEEHEVITVSLQDSLSGAQEVGFSNIGPTIGNELKNKSLLATVLVFSLIVAYISWSFRKSSYGPIKSWVFGVSALIALFHDLFVVIGCFAIFGYFFGAEIDTLFVTALLTVLGFSVHDTIVVFDRVRERIKSHGGLESFEDLINTSVNQTIVRSLGTTFTTMIVLGALLVFGGHTIRYFVIALLIGMAVGTYSSIFIASPLLLTWYKHKTK